MELRNNFRFKELKVNIKEKFEEEKLMKVVTFHGMNHRGLPEDFEEKYKSVWVTTPRSLYDPEEGHVMFNDYLDELEYAIDLGYDGVAVNEHHSNAFGLSPSPNLWGSILARKVRNTNAAIVIIGNSLALYNPPIRIAEELGVIDNVSGGRLIAGFPQGTSMDTNYVYGINPSELRERYHEAHDFILKAWKTDEIFPWNGKYNQLRFVNQWPKPVQNPHPPIWIPGTGSIETMDFAINNNYAFCFTSYYGHGYAKKVMESYWDRVQKLDGNMNPYRVATVQIICVSETDEKAKLEYEDHVRYYFNKAIHVDPRVAVAPGYRSAESIKAGLVSQFNTDDKKKEKSAAQLIKEGASWEELIESGLVVAGSPSTVVDQIKKFTKDIRIGTLIAMQAFGSMPHDLAMKNLKLFADEVKPHLKDIWSEYDYSDYYPSGLKSEQQQQQQQQKTVNS